MRRPKTARVRSHHPRVSDAIVTVIAHVAARGPAPESVAIDATVVRDTIVVVVTTITAVTAIADAVIVTVTDAKTATTAPAEAAMTMKTAAAAVVTVTIGHLAAIAAGLVTVGRLRSPATTASAWCACQARSAEP